MIEKKVAVDVDKSIAMATDSTRPNDSGSRHGGEAWGMHRLGGASSSLCMGQTSWWMKDERSERTAQDYLYK